MSRWFRGLASAGILLLGVVGAPTALAQWGHYQLDPLWQVGVASGGSLLLVALTAIGWLAWAVFTLATGMEAAALLGGRPGRRWPMLTGLQDLVATLLLAVLALGGASAGGNSGAPQAAAETRPQLPDEPRPVAPAGTYLVAPGDDLWTVAQHLLGDGSRWRELVAANPGVLDPAVPLAPGTRLILPSGTRSVVVKPGDTLSGLALEHLGAARRWPRIARANPELVTDPDHIEVGWRLVIPGAADRAGDRTREPGPPGPDRPRRESRQREDVPGSFPSPTAQRQPVDTGSPSPAGNAPTGAPDQSRHASRDIGADVTAPLLGTLGTLAAAAIIGVVETRRYLRLRERPVGRRLLPPGLEQARLQAAIGRRQRPELAALLDAALRELGQHFHNAGQPLPGLDRVTAAEDLLRFDWAEPAGSPPPGFAGDQRSWRLPPRAAGLDPTGLPCPYPAVVSLGAGPDGLLLVDVERSRVLGVAAPTPELRRSSLTAIAVELACAPWAAETRLVVVGPEAALLTAVGEDRVTSVATAAQALAELRSLVAERRAGLAGQDLAVLRTDPDRAPALSPVVFGFFTPPDRAVAEELDAALAGPPCGVAALVEAGSEQPAQWRVSGDSDRPTGRLVGRSSNLVAHTIGETVRAGVAALLDATAGSSTEPAAWWATDPPDQQNAPAGSAPIIEDPVDIVTVLPPEQHPEVLLIGPAELRHAAGQEPPRSRQQLIELGAWLLEHPGRTATEMAAGLVIAEGTRRSNLSRLRSWLGQAADGSPYLPEAYSGHIALHPAVGCDWHRVQLLLAPGVNRVGEVSLIAALELVRGAPMADAAPGQYHWAEELRLDIASLLRDVGVVLAAQALDRGEIDLARWAAARALVVAPADEQLMCARIRTERRAGNGAEVERLVRQVTRQARQLGVDLLPETVLCCQQAVEGGLRARRV